MSDWATNERKWLDDAKKLMRRKPARICLYTLHADVVACKSGISCLDVSESIARNFIEAGDILTLLHDDRQIK